MAEQKKSGHNQSGRKHRRDVKPPARSHPNGCDHKDRGRGGQAGGQAAVMDDGAGANETDPGNNLRRDSGRIGWNPRQAFGKQREHGRAEADEQIGAETGGAVLPFALEPN